MERDHFEWEAVAGGDECAHLDVFLGGATVAVVVAADADVEEMKVESWVGGEGVDHHGAVDAARNKNRYRSLTHFALCLRARLAMSKAPMRYCTSMSLTSTLCEASRK